MLGLFVQLISLSAALSDSGAGCFQQHLEEARQLNWNRASRYSALTYGESLKISSLLISTEFIAQFTAASIDKEAERFVPYGVSITCEDFVSMKTVTSFKSSSWPKPKLESYFTPDLSEFKSRARKMVQSKAWDDLTRAIEKEIKVLERIPDFNCMTRHLLESAAKISSQAPDQLKKLRSRHAPDAEPLIQKLLSNHFMLLNAGALLDLWAASIQSRGVPIICQDVPKIALEWEKK